MIPAFMKMLIAPISRVVVKALTAHHVCRSGVMHPLVSSGL